ncbi:MAG: hypothetical protein ABEJ82_02810 [Haloplanus sp.]
MSGHPFIDDSEESGKDSEDSEGEDKDSERTKIQVSIGELSITVENHSPETARKDFYEIYEYVMSDIDEWSRAMDNVLTQQGGFQ